MQAAIKKFLSLVIPPGTPEPRPKLPAPHFAFTTPVGLKKAEANAMAEEVRIALEKQTGKKLQIVHLGTIPCNCPECRAKAAAPWN
jgi:hypothetical protein